MIGTIMISGKMKEEELEMLIWNGGWILITILIVVMVILKYVWK